jgi:hypothetical protein
LSEFGYPTEGKGNGGGSDPKKNSDMFTGRLDFLERQAYEDVASL